MRLLEHFAERGHEDDDKNNRRQRIKHVHDPHQNAVHTSADVTGNGAPQNADDQADQRADHADQQRNLRAKQHARKHIAPMNIRAEPVLRVRVAKIARRKAGRDREVSQNAPPEIFSTTGQAQ